jgi:hypothetical protein
MRKTRKNTGRESSLKGRNAAFLWVFIGVNLAIFLSVLVGKELTEIDHFWQRVTSKDGIIAAGVPLLAIILSGVLGDTGKARIVFWRWRNPLPGCRAFTELIATDPRIDVLALKQKVGPFPRKPHEQNALWYRLYRGRKNELVVSQSHRIYLLTRDLAALAALFVILFSTGLLLGAVNTKTVTLYIAALVLQYFLVASAARNYGTRFVLNVLSEESHAAAS